MASKNTTPTITITPELENLIERFLRTGELPFPGEPRIFANEDREGWDCGANGGGVYTHPGKVARLVGGEKAGMCGNFHTSVGWAVMVGCSFGQATYQIIPEGMISEDK
ncbi:MAG: hypothetical protein COU34_05460 [Candidatus Magasanikbacteria bacterium CG10_big_fil_rev_8_21_14_0_10_43_9]|nr:MAG: hypothetical protein COU34_05460 [Candidatus Magasanikbacteria bacterium CG10_big_fil_rev_8_21_14_0_10_43_9]